LNFLVAELFFCSLWVGIFLGFLGKSWLWSERLDFLNCL
jgi:hypothetical protein